MSSGAIQQEPLLEAVVSSSPSAEAERALEAQARGLASEIAEAGRRLSRALAEKDQLARVLNSVLESLEAGVILRDAEGRLLAHNRASRALGAVVRIAEGQWALDGHLEQLLEEGGRGGAARRVEGSEGAAWMLRVSPVSLGRERAAELVVVHDVSEIVALEERAHRRTRLEALGRMVAEIAHEVRNPLGSLELFASMLLDDLEERPESREIVEEMMLALRRLSGTVTRLLSSVRATSGRRVATDLQELAREMGVSLRPVSLARGLELEVPGPEREAIVLAVEVEPLRQALLNLVGNAIEATPAGGRVRVSAELEEGRPSLVVEDSGPGIPAELRGRVLEPFFTTRAEGTGLGLALVERVALAHGARLCVGEASLGGARLAIIFDETDAAAMPASNEEARR